MSKNNKLMEDVPSTTHEFQIEITGDITRKRFLGDFISKIPTIKDQAMIARHEVTLNGDNPMYLDEGVRQINKKIAHLRFTLVEFPKFWRDSDLGYELRDPNVIDAVYQAVIDYENDWVNSIWTNGQDPEEEVTQNGSTEKEEKGSV